MIRRRPLATHPEFTVLECPGYREYRVENCRRMINSAGATSKVGTTLWCCPVLVLFVAICWQMLPGKWCYIMLSSYTVYVLRSYVFQVLYESVVILPPHGLQLETHRGFSKKWPILSKRSFIPQGNLDAVVINEGLKGWNVLFYLVAIKCMDFNGPTLEVAFHDLLPSHHILLQVFEGIYELLLSNPTLQKNIEDFNIPN